MDASPFSRYLLSRFVGTIALQVQLLVVGWHVYRITRSPMALGYVGLAQFLPSVGLVLVTGAVADRHERTRVLGVSYAALGACALLLSLFSRQEGGDIRLLYGVLFLVGCARAFAGPAGQALLPLLVPQEELSRGIAKAASVWQFATILGPALGGFVYRAAPSLSVIYGGVAALMLASSALFFSIRLPGQPQEKREISWSTVLAGLSYITGNPVLLGAISLDFLAVLLGGAVALLPAVAQDVLKADADALGLMRSAPAVGALVTGLWLTRRPLERRAGAAMLACVFGFGVATIGFGLARTLPLSLLSLVLLGAFDMVSMSVRQTLIQLRTPQEMRGRVSAVNLVFIGASNELGEFESGLTAAWLGVVPAIVAGGVGTCVVVIVWALCFADLRRYEQTPAQS